MAIARWNDGRAQIDLLIADNKLQRVPASRELADRDIALAGQKISSANQLLSSGDIPSALSLAYDSARLALTAVLANEGLRPTTTGGHVVLTEATTAQLSGSTEMVTLIRRFDRIRRDRNRSQYPALDDLEPTEMDVRASLDLAAELVAKAVQLIDVMPVY